MLINRSAVKGCVEVLLELREDVGAPSVYLRDLEPAILRESEIHYRAEGEKLLATCSTPECLRKVRKFVISPRTLLMLTRSRNISLQKSLEQTTTCSQKRLCNYGRYLNDISSNRI